MQKFHSIGLLYGFLMIVLIPTFRPASGYAADFLLKWNPNNENDLLGYYVYCVEGASLAAGPAGATKLNIALDTPGFDAAHPSYTLSGLKDGTLYSFAVSAYNAAGESIISSQVSMNKSPSDPGGSADAPGTDSTGGSGGSGGCFIGAAQQLLPLGSQILQAHGLQQGHSE